MAEQNGNRPRAAEARRAVRGLGTLEAQLMEALWASTARLSVQEVCDALGPGHNYKTVMTVLNRLVEKELLERELDGRAYRYRPHQSRQEFLRSVANELVHGYLEAYGSDAGSHLTGAVDAALPRPAAGGAAQAAQPSFAAPEAEERKSPITTLLGIAVLLEFIALLFNRRKR